VPVTANLIWLPAFFLLVVITSLGVGLWLSALNVEFRDVRYVVPFITQVWLFATPIAYPTTLVPEEWRVLYGLNPMVGVVVGFRWALLGAGAPPGLVVIPSATVALLLLIGGAYYFRRMERTFADVI
jgi:lipopolysaccharide transport system permease protein